MMSQASSAQPPRIAVWLVGLFTPDKEAEPIPGDLLEEFSHLTSTSGLAFARRWYWRQAVKTSAHLFGRGFRLAPLSTVAVLIGGFLLHRFVSGLPDKLLAAATDRYLYYWSNHFKAYMFWATKGMLIAHIIASIFVGCIVALAAKGREMAATMTLGFVLGAMTAAGLFVLLANTGDTSFLWILAFQCVDSLAIVSGGAIVRMRRSVATTRPSIT